MKLLIFLWVLPSTLVGLLLAYFGKCYLHKVDQDGVFYFIAQPSGLYHKWFAKTGFAGSTTGFVIVYYNEKYAKMKSMQIPSH